MSTVNTDDKNYIYDTNSGALLNTDNNALERHKSLVRRAQYEQQLELRVARLEELVRKLEEKIANG